MADVSVRAFPLYYGSGGRQIGTAHGIDYSVKAGRTRKFGSQGYLAHTKGSVITDLKISYIVPTTPMDVPLIEDTINQKDVYVGVLIAGSYQEVKYAITENGMTSETESGDVEGTLMLEGGKPTIKKFGS